MKGKQTEFHTFIPHSPKMFLSVLIFALFFVSCGQVEDTTVNIKQPEIPAATDSEYCTIRLSLSMEQSAVRGIVPSYDLETLYYKFGYVSGSSGAVFEFPGDGEPGADYATITAKQFQILTGKYMFSLTAYPDSSCTAGTQVLEYVSAEMSLGVDTTSIACPLQPPSLTGTAAKGSVSAEFSFPALADIVEVTAKLFLISNLITPKNTQTLTPVESASGMTVTYAVSDIASGTYILLMTFTDSFGKGTIIPERVTVATNGTSIPDSSTGKINLSEKLEAKYRCHVKASGNDSSGTGSVFSPYQTVGGAVSGINARSMADKNWTIVVNGTVTGTSAISSVKAASLSIEGRTGSDTDILDGNSNGTVLKISTAVPVTLKNIKITNGKYDMGGGVLVNNTDASVTLGAGAVVTGNTNSSTTYGGGGVGVNGGLVICDGATIKANTAQTSGGGVFVFKGKFRLVSGSIGGTNADDANTISGSGNAVGGGVVVTANGTFTMTGGTITGNESKVGGGIYVLGTFAMEGGTISENIALNGGGVYNGGSATISGGTITRNGAVNGAGIMNAEGKTLSMTGGTISANSAETGSGTTECNGGGIYNGGTVFLSGTAVIGSNSATNSGGGVYNSGGTVYLSGSSVIGSLSADTAPASGSSVETVIAAGGNYSAAGGSSGEGGGIYSSGGKIYLGYTDADTPDASFTGGICANYSAMAAGGVSLASKAELYMSGGNLSYNRSKNGGGAVKTAGSAVIRISGGTVTGNRAGGSGGGIYIGSAESFYMTGGIVSDNEGTGGGVYSNGGTFSIGGNAYIPVGESGKNVVYLVTAAKITLASPLTSTKTVATITPASYTEGKEILVLAADCSESLAAGSAKFAVTPNGTQTWTLDTEGKLAKSTGLDATAMASFEPTAGESYNFVITGGDSETVNEFIRTLCDKTKNTSSTLIGESVLDLSKCDFAVAFNSLAIKSANSVIPQNFTTVILPAVTAPSDIQGFRFKNAFQNVQEVIVPSGATKLYVEDGVVYSKDKTQLVWYPASKEGESYTVLPTVTTINAHAVEYAKNLKTMILPDGLKTINSDAFYQAKIEYITIPEGVVSISSEVFCNCAKLQTVSLPSTLTTLSSRAFGYCSLLKTVNIPSKLTNLYDDAFVSCSSLQSITIPAGITSIHRSSFSGCTSLTSVVFENTSGWTNEDGNAVTVDTPAAGATAVRSGKTLTRK